MHHTSQQNVCRRILTFAIVSVIGTCGVLPALGASDAYAARDWGGSMWKLEGKRVRCAESSGSWQTGVRSRADASPGDTITMNTGRSVSNSLNASLGIPRSRLNAAFQFNVSHQWTASAGKTYSLEKKKKGSWWAIQYKKTYKNYRIRARKYSFYDGKWHRTGKTRWVRARRFDHFAYRLVRARAPR